MAHYYGRYCGNSGYRNHRYSNTPNYVHGEGCPQFHMTQGEIVPVFIDVADRTQGNGHRVTTGYLTLTQVSSLSGTSVGVLSGSVSETQAFGMEFKINVQDVNLEAGDVWHGSAFITLDDGSVVNRQFKVSVKSSTYVAPVLASTTATAPTVTQAGTVISGGSQLVPVTANSGTYSLTPPAGAAWAVIQFYTNGVWTVDGSDPAGGGFNVAASTPITVQNANELASFKVSGANSGADAVQIYVQYYTGDPNP